MYGPQIIRRKHKIKIKIILFCRAILGKGEEFRDLDIVMKRMEHWAHRLYPKLPFDDVMNRISVLGKKKTVQVGKTKVLPDVQW